MIVKDILCIGVNGMISNQILQNTVEGLKQISRVELGIIDTEGNVLAATFPEAGDVYVIGSVVGTHAGPGVAAIAYFEKRD